MERYPKPPNTNTPPIIHTVEAQDIIYRQVCDLSE